jgi:hypothetical protein
MRILGQKEVLPILPVPLVLFASESLIELFFMLLDLIVEVEFRADAR